MQHAGNRVDRVDALLRQAQRGELVSAAERQHDVARALTRSPKGSADTAGRTSTGFAAMGLTSAGFASAGLISVGLISAVGSGVGLAADAFTSDTGADTATGADAGTATGSIGLTAGFACSAAFGFQSLLRWASMTSCSAVRLLALLTKGTGTLVT